MHVLQHWCLFTYKYKSAVAEHMRNYLCCAYLLVLFLSLLYIGVAMLKSSNLNSVINELAKEETLTGDNLGLNMPSGDDGDVPPALVAQAMTITNNNANMTSGTSNSLAALQLAAGLLQIAEPPLIRVRSQLKELIGKQNKIYIDLSKEKYKLDCSEIAKLNDMMTNVRVYKDKLVKIKKEMQSIYQRTKVLKKRAANVAACKQRQYQRKLDKQNDEESLIGSQSQ